MNEIDTPRSEKAANESISEVYRTSQQLERELAQSIEANAGLYKACDALESQLNVAKADLEFRRDLYKVQEIQLNHVRAELNNVRRELNDATKQRDELAGACAVVVDRFYPTSMADLVAIGELQNELNKLKVGA